MDEALQVHGQDELEYLLSATLITREKFLQLSGAQHGDELDARSAASRNKFFVRNADSDSLIAACTAKLDKEPGNTFALWIRANEFLKKGAPLTHLAQVEQRVHAGT